MECFHLGSLYYMLHEPIRCLQVKLLKCLVDNIVVDISFNQLGGLCTLVFLESIDRRVAQENLFKRSIILVRSDAILQRRMKHLLHSAKWTLILVYIRDWDYD